MVRLGTWMPFSPAGKMLSYFTKVNISESTVQRTTERAGRAYVGVQTAQLELIEKELPDAPPGPPMQQVSVDGAMVPLVHKEWAEVKTLAVGTVSERMTREGERETYTKDLSYFSRLADSESFSRLATVETHRRGTENADLVCAVVDGADWEQKFIDMHCPNAVRILDWGHAAEYVAKAGQSVFGSGTAVASQWIELQLHELKHGDSQTVLGKMRGLLDELTAQVEGGAENERVKTLTGSLEYLEKRQEQIRYAEFRAAGYPIGSGIVESANKLVVEARLKGAGMHWARGNVDGMVALRTIACSDRWEEAWPQISERLRVEATEHSERHRAQRRQSKAPVALESLVPAPVLPERMAQTRKEPEPVLSAKIKAVRGQDKPLTDSCQKKPKEAPRRPSADHPWRRMPIGRAKISTNSQPPSAET